MDIAFKVVGIDGKDGTNFKISNPDNEKYQVFGFLVLKSNYMHPLYQKDAGMLQATCPISREIYSVFDKIFNIKLHSRLCHQSNKKP